MVSPTSFCFLGSVLLALCNDTTFVDKSLVSMYSWIIKWAEEKYAEHLRGSVYSILNVNMEGFKWNFCTQCVFNLNCTFTQTIKKREKKGLTCILINKSKLFILYKINENLFMGFDGLKIFSAKSLNQILLKILTAWKYIVLYLWNEASINHQTI